MTKSANPIHEKLILDEHLAQSISAWMDGDLETELPPAAMSEGARQTWQTYHLIGDVLRTPALAVPVSSSFEERLTKALAQEAVVLAPRSIAPAPTNKQSLWRQYGVSSFAMAAAVAAVVWVVKPFFAPDMGPASGQASIALSKPAVSAVTAASADATETSIAPDYVAAHRQLAGPAAVRQVSFGGIK